MRQMYIDGKFTSGNAKEEITVQNPASEEIIDSVPRGTPEDIEAAVQAAKSVLLGEFRESKHVHWDFNMEDKPYWYPYG